MNWTDPLVIAIYVLGGGLLAILALALLLPQWPTIRQLFGGFAVDPALVAPARALASAAVALVATWLLAVLTGWQGTKLAALAVPLAGLVQAGWGVLDRALKGPGQNRADAPPTPRPAPR